LGVQRFSRPGIDIAFIDEGEGAPIILVHGFASNHAVNWVNTLWVKDLVGNGRRVIALDNRGHGQSTKFHEPGSYAIALFMEDVLALADHLSIEHFDLMGYSMGARIGFQTAMQHKGRVRSLLMGGLGINLVRRGGLPESIAEAMEVPDAAAVSDAYARTFRLFADATKSDCAALAAVVRGSSIDFSALDFGALALPPTLISVGSNDGVAGSGEELARLLPGARYFAIEGRDHNLAVGDKGHKRAVLEFLAEISPSL
jgi:pimeloyl-ACP methyl ester carboxylesterase